MRRCAFEGEKSCKFRTEDKMELLYSFTLITFSLCNFCWPGFMPRILNLKAYSQKGMRRCALEGEKSCKFRTADKMELLYSFTLITFSLCNFCRRGFMPRILNLKAYSQRGYEALRFRG